LIWGAVLALNVIAWMANWLKINQLSAQLIDISKEIMNTEIEIPGIDDIKDDILGTIQEMRPPNFLDHIGGAISNMLMFKMRSVCLVRLIVPHPIHKQHGKTQKSKTQPKQKQKCQFAAACGSSRDRRNNDP